MIRDALRDRQAWPLLAAVVIGGILVYLLKPILTPFLVGALLAYLGDPIADRLEACNLSRTLAVVIVFSVLLLIIIGAVLLLAPLLGHQIDYLARQLPQIIDWLQSTATPWLEDNLGLSATRLNVESLREAIAEHWQSTGTLAATVVAKATRSGLALAGLLVNLALIPVVGFYLLRDWDVMVARIRALIPRAMEETVSGLTRECNEVVAAFLRGQLLVMLALGIIYATGMWLVGLNLAVLIGLLAGVANIVPYLGFIVGISAASIATIFQFSDFWLPLAMIWGVFLVGQALEGTVLTPWLVGDRIGLHPVAVIFAVLAGGQLFGFVGVLLALPVAAVVMVLLRYARDRYLESRLYGPADRGDAE